MGCNLISNACSSRCYNLEGSLVTSLPHDHDQKLYIDADFIMSSFSLSNYIMRILVSRILEPNLIESFALA
jgi:hypothetical protein